MLVEAVSARIYGAVFLSLILVDYILGHGFVDIFQKIFCKVACFVKKTVREEAKHVVVIPDTPISLPALFIEILVLSLIFAFLKKYKNLHSKDFDRLDDLLHESKEALRQTNELLDKWRLRRVPTEYSYLDEEPQEVKPLKIEVPILHMAIIDTLETTRSQPERGDAGDAGNITDSTLLSATSLLDDELDSIPEPFSSVAVATDEKAPEETRHVEFRERTLWDVMEEDANTLED